MKLLVNYKGHSYKAYVDGAGLDIECVGDKTFANMDSDYYKASHELFCKAVDTYPVVGLEQALTDAGAVIIAVEERVNL